MLHRPTCTEVFKRTKSLNSPSVCTESIPGFPIILQGARSSINRYQSNILCSKHHYFLLNLFYLPHLSGADWKICGNYILIERGSRLYTDPLYLASLLTSSDVLCGPSLLFKESLELSYYFAVYDFFPCS